MLGEVPQKRLDDFSEVSHLVKYVRKHWNCAEFKPKNYDLRKKSGLSLDPHVAADQASSFRGINDDSATSFPFPLSVSTEHVYYSDVEQGRDPLETLISACVGYGMRIEAERCRRRVVEAAAKLESHELGYVADATKLDEGLVTGEIASNVKSVFAWAKYLLSTVRP